ncbi:tyrosine-type recombinase/integrase [Frisingicoccus sp.]|uniref:tyrosine-type recombinase/integrase n=1 Tax=Frisingicoccus sp. TaxID=1918627 RepID=UPI003AB51B4A
MKRRKELLEKHPYKIWRGKDEFWHTYLPNGNERKPIKKKEKKAIEEAVIEFYKNQEEIFIEDVFNSWVTQKYEYKEIQKQTYDRYKTDFIRFFKDSSLYKKDIRKITEEELEEFIRKTINDKQLSNKAYSGLRLLIIGIFKYAKKHKYTEISITNFFGDLELPKKCFSKKVVLDKDSVFTDMEVEKICSYIKENESLINYGILLTFQTGLRVGELCTLKYSDIHGNKLSVRRTEIRYKDENDNYIIEVRESPKTDAGNRDIILNSNAQKTLKEIRRLNPFGEFMFMRNGQRIKEKAFGNKITKICQYVGIKERSMHKARKTYATKLINGGVDESLIIKQMGHTSIDCTKNYYYFNNKTDEEAAMQIERAISY